MSGIDDSGCLVGVFSKIRRILGYSVSVLDAGYVMLSEERAEVIVLSVPARGKRVLEGPGVPS